MRNKGISIVEVIISVALFAIMTTAFYKIYMTIVRSEKPQLESIRLDRMLLGANTSMLNGTMPNSSNLPSLLQQWADENIVANNFNQKYYFAITSALSNMQTSDLCSSINSLPSGSTFSVQLLNGNVINNVIYLLISPTGKGQNTLQLNNLTPNGNFVAVPSGATVKLSPYDMVRYETVDGYNAFCIYYNIYNKQ